uniref:Nucleoside diphosphate kinase n=1 Tax=Cyprinus carpio TaxID=7962 RepID=A0A8C1J599_CYPCA
MLLGGNIMDVNPLCKQAQRHQHAVAILNGQIPPKALKSPPWHNSVSLSAFKGVKLICSCFVCLSSMQADEDLLRQHYCDLKDLAFFPGLLSFMSSGPLVAMVWEGFNVIKTGRVMLGKTNPIDSNPGTIRGDFCVQVVRNIIHGSDSVESANTEINLWFNPEEICDYTKCQDSWLNG